MRWETGCRKRSALFYKIIARKSKLSSPPGLILAIVAILLSACASPTSAPQAAAGLTSTVPPATSSAPYTVTPLPTAKPQATNTIQPTPTATAVPPTATPAPAVLIGAGDVVVCGVDHDEQTAAIVEEQLALFPDATVFMAGDEVNESGRAVEYRNCFTPSWGRFLERIRPVPGNHDVMTDQGAPYYAYFGKAAGEPGEGYYSYDLGSWHIVALNSNCDVIACGKNSQQVQWLTDDLQKNQQPCTLLYWHHPRFGSGIEGSVGLVSSFFRTAYEFGAEVILNGNDHDYERFAPQDPDGNLDLERGMREFVVGTGGAELRGWGTVKPNSEVRDNQTHGVILFELYPDHYTWNFLPSEGGVFTDNGSGTCH
jgi:acid phosphatase type 7